MLNFNLTNYASRSASVDNIVGLIQTFLSPLDPRPAAVQLDDAYIGGWDPFQGFEKSPGHILTYPGDPPQYPLAEAHLRDEHILVYPCAWVVIIQPGGAWEVARMD